MVLVGEGERVLQRVAKKLLELKKREGFTILIIILNIKPGFRKVIWVGIPREDFASVGLAGVTLAKILGELPANKILQGGRVAQVKRLGARWGIPFPCGQRRRI